MKRLFQLFIVIPAFFIYDYSQSQSKNQSEAIDILSLVIIRESYLGFSRMGSAQMPNGDIFLCGGSASNFLNVDLACFSYDEGKRKSNLSVPRSGSFSMTAIDDRLIYIAGGDKADYNTMSTTEIYDTKENKSSIFVPMVEERSRHTATLLKNNEVFLAGGNIGVRERISDSWQVVNTQSGINLQKGTLNYARYRHKAQLLSNGDVLRIGGENFSDTIEDLELFNARLRTISSNGKLKESRSYHSIVYFDDNNIFIIGGINRDKNKDRYLRSIERFDKSRNESEIVANFEEPRAHVNAKKITNSEILICGGVNGNISPKKHFSDCLLFNIETKRFSHFTNLTKPRIYSTVDLTSDGQFLLCGGNSLDSLYNDCETVDLKTRTATIRFPRLF